MDCRAARSLLPYARPRPAELAEPDRHDLEGHLGGCAECDALFRGERRFDGRLAAAMRDVPVPEGLRARVWGRLEAERNAYHRKWLARVAGGLAAAAAVVAAVWYAAWGPRPPADIDVDDLRTTQNYISFSGEQQAQVEQWYRDVHGLSVAAPPAFDYSLLASWDVTVYKKKPVPVLVFAKPRDAETCHYARVWVLSKRDFDVNSIQAGASSGGGYKVRVLDHPTLNQVAYLVFYTSDQVEDFFVRAGAVPARSARRAAGVPPPVELALAGPAE